MTELETYLSIKNKNQMPKREFVVLKEHLADFFNKLDETELDPTLTNVSEDGEALFVEVIYSNKESDTVIELIDLLQELESADESEEDDDEQ